MSTIEELHFYEPRIEDAVWAEPALRSVLSPLCEYNFATIFMWRKYYHHRIARVDDRVLVESYYQGNRSFLFPAGEHWQEDVQRLRRYVRQYDESLILYGVDAHACKQLVQVFPHSFRFSYDAGDSDYIYTRKGLAGLEGKPYQKKRNHIAAFSRDNAWSYEPLTEDNTTDALAFAEQWYTQAEPLSDSLAAEREVLPELLRYREQLCLRGGLIRVDGTTVAMTLASLLNPATVDIQFEKAFPQYAGAYAVINQQFAQHALSDVTFINRENDLGIEGLRRAKQSYRPFMLAKKYAAIECR